MLLTRVTNIIWQYFQRVKYQFSEIAGVIALIIMSLELNGRTAKQSAKQTEVPSLDNRAGITAKRVICRRVDLHRMNSKM